MAAECGLDYMAKILLAEDDKVVAESVADALELDHHAVESVDSGIEAADRLKLYEYDLAILDRGLPGIDGLEILRKYRAGGGSVPILILTGKNEVHHRIEGLNSGADDYLGKPFSMDELLARVRTLLRRPANVTSDDIKIGTLTVHLRKSTATRDDGEEIALLAKELAVLEFLLKHRGQRFTVSELLNRVWKSESDSTEDAVRQCMVRLRKKIDRPGEESLINTARNLGYMIE